ncbi:unnamed protein product [Closterium sp. Naga37s-1]|nr:unnamed protein product [Closterium sp. Naga37s-1]
MDELTGLEETTMEEWKKVWEEVKILPTGMWTQIWARGVYLPRTRFDDIIHDALLPAVWFPIKEETKEEKAESVALMSAMIHCVSMCAAFGKVAVSAARKAGDTDEKTELAAEALAASACAVWCFVETGGSVLSAVSEGKAAAMVAGASEKTADVFKEVMQAVLDVEIKREPAAGEVAHNVAPALQKELDIAVPSDVQMEYDLDHKGRKGEKGK